MNINIRPARRRDAADIACLADIAGHGIESETFAGWMDEDHSPLAAARHRIITDETLPHHISNVSILEANGEVAGFLAGNLVTGQPEFHGSEPEYLRPLVELEAAVEGFWTVVMIAVYREFRGHGLAGRLLQHALLQACEANALGLSIVVEDTNEKALGLYRRFGYTERERRAWLPYGARSGPKDWVLLTRPVDQPERAPPV